MKKSRKHDATKGSQYVLVNNPKHLRSANELQENIERQFNKIRETILGNNEKSNSDRNIKENQK